MFVKPGNWDELTSEEKRKRRLDHWVNVEGIKFESPEAETTYKARIARLRATVEVKVPDRVPSTPSVGGYALKRAGLSSWDTLYDYDSVVQSIVDFHKEFEPDATLYGGSLPGRVWDILDYKVYIWAGHGLPKDTGFQTVEGEYMTADEYPALIADPSGFWLKTYLPRVCGALKPFEKLFDLPRVTEILDLALLAFPFGMPDVQEALHKLMEAGQETMKWLAVSRQIGGQLTAAGFPALRGTFCKAPFDMIGDTLRGTRGIMLDMYRRPNEVLAACETLVPIVIQGAIKACDQTGGAFAFFPLHKGADGFMSGEQFEKFYWSSLRQVMLSLNEEGIVCNMFAEGRYTKRLETIAELPKGSVIWHFDQTDMRRAKEVLGGRVCIMGNVPASLMSTGTVEKLLAYCRDLLEIFDSGGFILSNGASVDTTTDEHVRAMINVVRE